MTKHQKDLIGTIILTAVAATIPGALVLYLALGGR